MPILNDHTPTKSIVTVRASCFSHNLCLFYRLFVLDYCTTTVIVMYASIWSRGGFDRTPRTPAGYGPESIQSNRRQGEYLVIKFSTKRTFTINFHECIVIWNFPLTIFFSKLERFYNDHLHRTVRWNISKLDSFCGEHLQCTVSRNFPNHLFHLKARLFLQKHACTTVYGQLKLFPIVIVPVSKLNRFSSKHQYCLTS